MERSEASHPGALQRGTVLTAESADVVGETMAFDDFEAEAKAIIGDAQSKAKSIVSEAKEFLQQVRTLSKERDRLQEYLGANGIGTAIHYPVPIHLTTAGRDLGYDKGSFPKAERQARHILSLPVYAGLSTSQIERVCQCIRSFYN